MGFIAGSNKHKVKVCPKCKGKSWQGTGTPYFPCAHVTYEQVKKTKK
jgi:hypothetical protein